MAHDLQAASAQSGATVFAYRMHDPERYGVVDFDASGHAISLEEKPTEEERLWPIPVDHAQRAGVLMKIQI